MEREGIMCCRFVRLVERMRFRELGLVVDQLLLLFRRQHRKFGICWLCSFWVDVLFWLRREIVVVVKLGQSPFSSQSPALVVIVGNENHVVGIHHAEGSETITHQGEKGNQHIVDDIGEIVFPVARINPA